MLTAFVVCRSLCQHPEIFADRKLYLLLYPTLRRSSNLASNVTASSVTLNCPVSKSRKRGPIRPRFFVKQSAIMCMRSIQRAFVKLTKLLSASARQTLFSCPPRRQSHWLTGRRVTWHPQWPKHFRLVRTTLQSLTVFISHISVIRALPRERPTNEILWAPTTQEPKSKTKRGKHQRPPPRPFRSLCSLSTIAPPWAPRNQPTCCLLTCSHQAGADKANPFSERFNRIQVKPRFPLWPIDRQPITSQNVLYSDPGKITKRASGKFLNKRLRAGHAMRREGPRYPYKGPDSKMVSHWLRPHHSFEKA